MKLTHLFPLIASILFCVNLNAQEVKPVKQPKFKIASFSGYYSASDERLPKGTLEDFRKLAPESELLQQDFSSYQQNPYHTTIFTKMCAGYVGFEFNNKDKNAFRKNSYLDMGFNYSEDMNLHAGYIKSTFQDANPGDQDTAFYDIFSMTNTSKRLFLDLSLRYKILSKKRFSFYTGLGLSAGALYNNMTWVSNARDMSYYGSMVNYPEDSIPYNNSSIRMYAYKNKMGFAVTSYIPVGLDFRVGKKDNFFRMIHLFIEARPSAKVVFQPEIKPNFNAFLNYGFGVKFTRE